MIWFALALAGAVGALLVGMIGFGTSLVVLPALAIILPTMFAPETALRLATGTTLATMAVGAVAAGITRSRDKHFSWPLLRLAIIPYAAGALLGPWIAAHLPVDVLRVYVAGMLVVVTAAAQASGTARTGAGVSALSGLPLDLDTTPGIRYDHKTSPEKL